MRDPTRFDIRDILNERISGDSRFEDSRKVVSGFTLGVDSATSCAVDGRVKFIWFRESGMNGAVHQVFNPDKIPTLVNFPCKISHAPKEPYRWEVFDADWDRIVNLAGFINQNFGVGTHAPNHEWKDFTPGTDVTNIYPRALAPLRTTPGSGLSVNVWAHRYVYSNWINRFMGFSNKSLAAHQPASGLAVRVLVYLDKATNSLKTVAGSTVVDSPVITPPDPEMPAVDGIVSALVRLDGDQASFTEGDIYDVRYKLNEISKKPETVSSSGVTLEELARVEAELDFALAARLSLLASVKFQHYGVVTNVLGNSSGAVDLDLNLGNAITVTQTGNITFSFLNPWPSGNKTEFILKITNDVTGGYTRTWPGSVVWPGASEPTLSGGSNKVDIYTFVTFDGGTIYNGFLPGADMS